MNDEDFARQAFAAAFRSGNTGEPPTLPDVEGLASRGRRAARYRHGTYAAGTTALAGVVTAGIVTGPALLGLGSTSPAGVGAAAQGATTPPSSPVASSSSSSPDGPVKPSPGVPCATPPGIDWLSVVSAALPAGVTAAADHSANCVELPDGTRTVEALFKLSTGNVSLQVNVGTGPEIARKLTSGQAKIGLDASPAPGEGTTSADPATLAKLDAAKRALAGLPPASDTSSPSPTLDATAIASLEAQKRAFASTASDAPPTKAGEKSDIKPAPTASCSPIGPDENACVSHLTKDSISVSDVQILRTGANPIVVDVAASNGKGLSTPNTAQLPSDATMVAIATAVATHF
ncbi:MAG TPA: hypothetical protein VIL94_07615 [Acidothermaceae bacterium]